MNFTIIQHYKLNDCFSQLNMVIDVEVFCDIHSDLWPEIQPCNYLVLNESHQACITFRIIHEAL
jgi:hypothetical protein